ncbi:penicillin-binding protein [Bacillus sp. FJAT-50079]|uniref:penicillin-binding protein n=1 Tax=Bacillus sp. FJAT-50079 TaxID=2833577 RepID=UPI001BC92CD2|nr:penicillin-binding protein [Bacillus sp. FJAT-50079]MBS4207719.1 penicillin-binding protein [Bacillus sp. FJAT-50079]
MNVNKKNRNIGAAILFIFFGLLFFILVVRFISIQYSGEVKGTVLSAKAAQLYLQTETIKAKRGTIYDHNKEPIAEDSSSYTLVAILDENLTTDPEHPRHVVDPQYTAVELAKHIDMSEQEIYQRLTKPERKQVEFGKAGRDLSHNLKKAIEQLKLPGISFMKDSKRYYPNGIFASHLIGYAQKEQEEGKPSEIIGKMGLEKSYDTMLKGEDGSIQYEGDIWNYILPNSSKQVVEPKHGHDIYLTIDKKIQTFLEDMMSQVSERYTPERVMAIVAEAKTGKILAMAQRPTFHPDTREGIDQSWHNELVETSFEPGSTMKIFSLATAIEENKFNPNDKFKSGSYLVDQKSGPIRDHNRNGWGEITYLEGVQRSSNVAFAYLLEKMGTETWREYMGKFKFGVKTGIDLPNEVPGKILYDWPIEKVTSVYGQGTTVTAMQMIQAMTAIANDGKMMKPYVVEKIVDPNDDTVETFEPEMVGEPISKKTAKEVMSILETVITSENGTGKSYQLEGYKVAGKTGTAQISDRGYIEGNYLYSFLGAAPADDPELIMYVVVDRPKLEEGDHGSDPVSIIFNTVMENSLKYLNIEPEDIPNANILSLPDLTDMSLQEVNQLLEENGLVPIIIGNGEKIIGQSPQKGSAVIEGEKVIVQTDGDRTIPNMIGWSKRDVLKASRLLGIEVNMTGEGYVANQNLQPDRILAEGDVLVVTFETPKEALEREETGSKMDDDETPSD